MFGALSTTVRDCLTLPFGSGQGRRLTRRAPSVIVISR
jgi:hypothetical protein